jgi:hypothetical protein
MESIRDTNKSAQMELIDELLKLVEDGVTIDEISYALIFLNRERERKRNWYKRTGKPVGRPRKITASSTVSL